jgi:hypothetical protein
MREAMRRLNETHGREDLLLKIGIHVPFGEAQPSPDGEFWRCRRPNGSRRCFFGPPPST